MPQNFRNNFVLQTDSYKVTHWPQYPPGTQDVYSYLESRGGMFDETVMAGAQYLVKRYLTGQVFNMTDVDEAYDFSKAHFGNNTRFNYNG